MVAFIITMMFLKIPTGLSPMTFTNNRAYFVDSAGGDPWDDYDEVTLDSCGN